MPQGTDGENDMTKWTKVKPTSNIKGRAARSCFGVQRNRSGSKVASLIVPANVPTGERASVYSDGNGRLAFSTKDTGEYKVGNTAKGAKARKITIPGQYADLIPYGTRDAEVTFDGDMMVLDLSQFS